MKLAIFGGSFDPPHLGHERLVELVLNELDIDKLVILPAFLNPFKTRAFAPPNLRLKWLSIIFKDLPKLEISSFELEQKRPVPSIESVLYLAQIYKAEKIYLIIGADNLANLSKWQDYEKLKKLVEFVVIKRDKIALCDKFKSLSLNENISSSFIRKSKDFSKINEKIRTEVKKFYINFE